MSRIALANLIIVINILLDILPTYSQDFTPVICSDNSTSYYDLPRNTTAVDQTCPIEEYVRFHPCDAECIDETFSTVRDLHQADPSSNYSPIVKSDYFFDNFSSFLSDTNILGIGDSSFDFYQISAFTGGNASGTGNQNYIVNFNYGITSRSQVGLFYSEADDPLFSSISNKPGIISNFWQSYGLSFTNRYSSQSNINIASQISVEAWNVASGGTLGKGLVTQTGSPNIFNNSGERVFTRNFTASATLPVSIDSGPLRFTFAPSFVLLPSTQGENQGGSGQFYGSNFSLGGGLEWDVADNMSISLGSLFPMGPGFNTFDSNLFYSNCPIYSAGLSYFVNPKVGFKLTLTNSFGGTPATSILTLPSSNRPLYSASFKFNPDAEDSTPLDFNDRSVSLSMGGITVDTALVPPVGRVNTWINGDSYGNVFGQVAWSASNDFQFILFNAGAFQQVSPITPLVSTYANNGGFNQRFGGKAVFLQQLRGAPLTASGAITLGRNYDASSFQGYLFAEAIGTWEANKRMAFNLNPKLAWSGVATPFGIGVSANVQLGGSFQLIPEFNAIATDMGSSNGTLSLRWLPRPTTALDIYVSNAAGLYDMGQLLKNDSARVGAKFTVQL